MLPDQVQRDLFLIHIGMRIRARRKMRWKTQKELGDMMGGVKHQRVQKWEMGQQLTVHSLILLSEALDVPVAYFFDEAPSVIRAPEPARALSL